MTLPRWLRDVLPGGLIQRLTASARLLEQVQTRLSHDEGPALAVSGSASLQGLAEAINQLLAQRRALRDNVNEQVEAASQGVARERSRLAALMAELTQSVVVCNLDGRVLLYNNRARLQFRALSSAPAVADGAELLGLGRSIYATFDRQLVAHALESVQQRLARGARHPSAQFVTTTRSGQLLRVQLAPVRDTQPAMDAAASPPRAQLTGYVLMLDNLTQQHEQDRRHDQLLHQLCESQQASVARLQALARPLQQPALDTELQAMREQLLNFQAQTEASRRTRWPLEDMLGSEFMAAALRRLAALPGLRVALAEVDAQLWLRIDSYALLLALQSLVTRLMDEFNINLVQLRLQPGPAPWAHLDLIWAGQALSTETIINWERDPMHIGDQVHALTVREVMQRHAGQFSFERHRARQQAWFRFELPLASAQDRLDTHQVAADQSRPVFYDFDLFQASEAHHEQDQRRLVSLVCTVFDTETTGLNPSQGDQILQIGATRISGGKLRREESFEQLVNPQRDIPPEGIPIHGITPDMVQGQPTIDQVLPAFHTFAQDTVLVAHNAAFDMRFLQLREARSGVVFDQPVLDTLLLSAVVHPNQTSHRLEAIAERFGITVVGRHTALGDALVTAEVFLRLIPLLQAMGIETLGQARAAAQKTWYARLKY
jgi:DNA polymerase III subunit epsilon